MLKFQQNRGKTFCITDQHNLTPTTFSNHCYAKKKKILEMTGITKPFCVLITEPFVISCSLYLLLFLDSCLMDFVKQLDKLS